MPWKSFVRETGDTNEKTAKKEKHRVQIEGNSARAVYEEIIKQDYNTHSKQEVSKSQKKYIQSSPVLKLPTSDTQIRKTETQKKAITQTDINAILKAIEQKDLKYLLEHVTTKNVNSTDEFGWTPLMSAAYCGHIEIIEFLLRLGANRKIRDRSGYTAAQLALKRNYLTVVALLRRKPEVNNVKTLLDNTKETNETSLERTVSSKKSGTEKRDNHQGNKEAQKNVGFYCEICDATFYHATPKSHRSSTLHIFNTKPNVSNTMYGIAKHTKGYQMLLNTGWDEQGGLGPSGKGIKYPVKTYLKVDRKGFGQPIDKEPRVTHFKAGDTKAVSNTKLAKQKGLRKNDRERLLGIEARKERALRIALS